MVTLEKEDKVVVCTSWNREDWENTVRALLKTIANQGHDVPMDMFTLQMMMGLVEEMVLPDPLSDGRTCTRNEG